MERISALVNFRLTQLVLEKIDGMINSLEMIVFIEDKPLDDLAAVDKGSILVPFSAGQI